MIRILTRHRAVFTQNECIYIPTAKDGRGWVFLNECVWSVVSLVIF